LELLAPTRRLHGAVNQKSTYENCFVIKHGGKKITYLDQLVYIHCLQSYESMSGEMVEKCDMMVKKTSNYNLSRRRRNFENLGCK
jgi:hypothetical protein